VWGFARPGPGTRKPGPHVRGEVEDILQETFLRVLLAEAGGIVPRDYGAYLRSVAYRVACDHGRNLRALKRGGG
jgi:DNA-directed RNA polymerase specialized sigma24 family protein